MTGFTVKHDTFEGPLEMLLNLIEQRKLHINDVTLSSVTDDFLNYAKSLADFPIAEGAQFALVASTLLLIKSKALLPQLSLSQEEETNIEDLQNRLRLLQRFRQLSSHLRERFGEAPLYLPLERKIEVVFAPPRELSSSLLKTAIRAVLAAVPKAEVLSKVAIKKIVSLESMIEKLKDRITSALRMSFKEFSGTHKGERIHSDNFFDEKVARINIIVGFLAMLELIKDGLITANQSKLHGTIMMETGRVDIPRY